MPVCVVVEYMFRCCRNKRLGLPGSLVSFCCPIAIGNGRAGSIFGCWQDTPLGVWLLTGKWYAVSCMLVVVV